MWKYDVKQAIQVLKQNPLFSMLYMIGTALAICFTLVIVVVHYVKLAPIYPEYHRGKTLYLPNMRLITPDENSYQSNVSYLALKEWFYPLKNAAAVSANAVEGDKWVQPTDNTGDFKLNFRMVDPAYFKIYEFKFLEGAPFLQADFESGIRQVVVTDAFARKLFDTEREVVGKSVKIDYVDYRVCGVVKSASPLTDSYAEAYLPYTTDDGYETTWIYDYLGSFRLVFMVESDRQAKALDEELQTLFKHVNQVHKSEWRVDYRGLSDHFDKVVQGLSVTGEYNPSYGKIFRRFFLIFLALLIVPAVNLSGMISSRMEERLPEMGVRKSFGADRKALFRQVIGENLVLTLCSGMLGMVLSWIVLYAGRNWIFGLFDKWNSFPEGVDLTVTGEMLFSPTVFICVLVVCFMINMLSAAIPAWHALRKPIVNALNEKR